MGMILMPVNVVFMQMPYTARKTSGECLSCPLANANAQRGLRREDIEL